MALLLGVDRRDICSWLAMRRIRCSSLFTMSYEILQILNSRHGERSVDLRSLMGQVTILVWCRGLVKSAVRRRMRSSSKVDLTGA